MSVVTNTISRLTHRVGKFGWGLHNETIPEKLKFESKYLDFAASANPAAFSARPAKFLNPKMLDKWNAFQQKMGRSSGSCDMTLLPKFIFGKRFNWFPQGIGSCVWSNTYRIWFLRALYEVALKGDPEEYFGRSEYGVHSIVPHCVQYGFARQLANMRGSDGLYCKPMADSLLAGVIMCSIPKLKELMDAAGAKSDYDYPEPRSNSLYRAIGDWKFNESLRKYLSNPVTGSESVRDADSHLKKSKEYKPIFQCSGIAMKAVGRHKDGFTIHVQDQNNTWPHNMGHAGMIVASDSAEFVRFTNLSWYNDPDPEGTNPEQDVLLSLPPIEGEGDGTDGPDWDDPQERFIYNVPIEELDRWYKRKLPDSSSIEEIDLPDSVPTI